MTDLEYTLHMLKCAEQECSRLRAELAEAKAMHAESIGFCSHELWKAGEEIHRVKAELAEARALVAKREAQIEWAAREGFADGGDWARKALYWDLGPDGFNEVVEYDGTRAGLLAAVDEATKP